MPDDRLSHGIEIRVLDERDVLGIETLRQRGEADKIGEQDGDDPSLDSTLGRHRS